MRHPEHTPGPWEVGCLDQNGQRVVRQEHIEICTCWHHCVASIEMEMEANARLIAAAPDILSELRKQVDWLRHIRPQLTSKVSSNVLNGLDQSVKYMSAAIAKAEGR